MPPNVITSFECEPLVGNSSVTEQRQGLLHASGAALNVGLQALHDAVASSKSTLCATCGQVVA